MLAVLTSIYSFINLCTATIIWHFKDPCKAFYDSLLMFLPDDIILKEEMYKNKENIKRKILLIVRRKVQSISANPHLPFPKRQLKTR